MSIAVGAVFIFEGDLSALALAFQRLDSQTVKPQQVCLVIDGQEKDALDWAINRGIPVAEKQAKITDSVNNALAKFDWWQNDSSSFFWLLSEKVLVEPNALAELLRSAEKSPSVAIVAPKLLKQDSPRYLHQVGISLTPWGGIFSSAEGQLDQGQFDDEADILAVPADASLIRADLWDSLQGYDRRLHPLASEIDFSIRARLAGSRVEVAPTARASVTAAISASSLLSRKAELELKAAYASFFLAPLLWLFLPLWGLVRAGYQVAAKNLDMALVELRSSATAFLRPFHWFSINRRVSRKSFSQLDGLRATWAEVLSQRREKAAVQMVEHSSSTSAGGSKLWWFAALVAANFAFWPTDSAAVGGALKPLSDSWLRVFSHAGSSWQVAGFGAAIPADPINWVFAMLSIPTFFNPSLAIFFMLLLSRAVAFAGLEKLFQTLNLRSPLTRVIALSFAFWPSLSSSLFSGSLGAVLSLSLAPWLAVSLISVVDAKSSRVGWITNVGLAGLLLAAEVSASPSTLIVWVLFGLALALTNAKRVLRLAWVLLPTFAIFAPSAVFASVAVRHPLLALVDPVQAQGTPLTLWQAALGGPIPFAQDFWQLHSGWPLLSVGFILALAVVAGGLSRRALTLPLVLLFITAVTYGWLLSNTAVLGDNSSQNPAAVLGLAGLIALVLVAIGFDGVGLRVVLAWATSVLVLAPLVVTALLSSVEVRAGSNQVLPAIVQAEWQQGNHLRVLQLSGTNPVLAQLVTPESLTLDGQSLGYRYSSKLRAENQQTKQLSVLAANLVAASSTDLSDELRSLGVGFVFAPKASPQLVSSLDSSPQLEAVGNTKLGRLWRVTNSSSAGAASIPTQSQLWSITKGVQLSVLVVFALMAIPTGRRVRRQRDTGLDEGEANFAS